MGKVTSFSKMASLPIFPLVLIFNLEVQTPSIKLKVYHTSHMLVFVRRNDEDHPIAILKGKRMPSSVGTEMADKPNTCMEGFVAVGTGDDSSCQGPQSIPVFQRQLSRLIHVGWHRCRQRFSTGRTERFPCW